MTLKGSLEKKRKFHPLLHEILWTVRRYWWMSFVGMLLFFAFTYIALRLEGNDPDQFALIMWDSEVALRIAGVVYGLFAAVSLFRFLWSRRECGLYLSVGSARWKQFTLRYLFGFVSVVLGVVVPFLITYHSEMATIGEDQLGICARYTAIYVFSMTVLTLLSYTVGVLVSVLCGHFLSALLTAAGVLTAPYTLLWGVQQMLGFYLFGTPLGHTLLSNHLGAGLFTMLADQLPHMSFNKLLLDRYVVIAETDGVTLAEMVKSELPALPAIRFVLLFVLMVVLALLAGWAYSRRPAENAGKATVHPVLSHAVALTNGLCLAALVLNMKAPVEGVGGMVILTVLFLLVFVLATALVRWVLIRDLRGVVRHYSVPCGAAVLCLIGAVCLGTGWFGYSDYMPDAEDVQSVTVTYNQNPVLLSYSSMGSFRSSYGPQGSKTGLRGISDGEISLSLLYGYGFEADEDAHPVLTAPEDIETALAIHEAIIADGRRIFTGETAPDFRETVVPVYYRIIYQLKNGKTVERYYQHLSLATLEETVRVEDTLAYRTEIADAHASNHFGETNAFEFGDPLFANFTSVTLSDEEQDALTAALDLDVASLSSEERYFNTGDPEKDEVIGIIRTRMVEGNSLLDTHPTDRKYKTFYITAAYTNTLAFLEEKGLTSLFEGEYTVTDVRTQTYSPRYTPKSIRYALSYVFFSCDNTVQIELLPEYASWDHMEQLELSTEPVPEEDWDTYIQGSRAVALMTRPGRMVQIMLTNEAGEQKLVTRYLYDETIPAT